MDILITVFKPFLLDALPSPSSMIHSSWLLMFFASFSYCAFMKLPLLVGQPAGRARFCSRDGPCDFASSDDLWNIIKPSRQN